MTLKEKVAEIKMTITRNPNLRNDPFMLNTVTVLELECQFESSINTQLLNMLEFAVENPVKKQQMPDIVIGIDPLTNQPVGIDIIELSMSLLIGGKSGSGKSTCMYNILLMLQELDIQFCLLDPTVSVNGSHNSNLLSKGKNGHKVAFISLDTTSLFNPFSVPSGIKTEDWILFLGHIWANSFPMIASKVEFIRILEELYSDSATPTLGKFQKRTREKLYQPQNRLKRTQYLETLENVLSQIPQYFIETLECDKGLIPKLLDNGYSLVINSQMINTFSELLIQLMILWIVFYLADKERNKPFVIAIDEASYILRKPNWQNDSSILVRLLRENTRRLRIPFILASQTPSLLDPDAINNCGNIISFSYKSETEIDFMTGNMNITDDIMKRAAYNLSPGEAIISPAFSETRFIITPEIRFEDIPTDEMVRRHTETLLAPLYEHIRAEEQTHTASEPEPHEQEPEEEEPEPSEVQEPQETHDQQQDQPSSRWLNRDQERILETYVKFPFETIMDFRAHVDEAFATSNTKDYRLLIDLMADTSDPEKAIFQKESLPGTGKRGRPPEFYVLTTAGQKYCEMLNLAVPKSPRGDFQHSFLCYAVKRHFEKKHKNSQILLGETLTLRNNTRKEVDLLVYLNEKTAVAVEVNHKNTANLLNDITTLADNGDFSSIIVVNILKDEEKRVTTILKPLMDTYPQIEFKPATAFI